MHGDLGFSDFCEGSDWRAVSTGWADWADSVGSGWTWPLDPKTKARWATPEQLEWFSCMGSPATSPPLCPRWLLVGRHKCPDPPMADWGRPLQWLGGSGTGDTNWGNLLLNLVANRSRLGRCHLLHMVWKTLEGGTILFKYSGLDVIACLLPHSAGQGCVGLWELLDGWCTRSRFSIEGHKVGPTSCLLPLCMTLL